MVNPTYSSPLADGHLNGTNALPTRPGPKLYGSNDGAQSGSGTPIGFQRHPHNKILDNVAGSSLRQPSPQPTHLGISGGQHRILSEEDPGYIAAKFEGKEKQMDQGKPLYYMYIYIYLFFANQSCSHGPAGKQRLLAQ